MKRLLTATAMLLLAGAPIASAQSGTGGSSGGAGLSGNSPSATPGRVGAGEAPVGHRQPRRTDVPSERSIDQVDPADAALDRKIKSICRGC